jgi:hypothetical protein
MLYERLLIYICSIHYHSEVHIYNPFALIEEYTPICIYKN